MIEFKAWPKTPRLFRGMTITEKIDGTNAAVHIQTLREDPVNSQDFQAGRLWVTGADGVDYIVAAQSRNRLISVSADNYGFARWVEENAQELVDLLGPGTHYGEWWGRGIQRGYGLDHRRFSLFDVRRQTDLDARTEAWVAIGLDVVPVVWSGTFNTAAATNALLRLADGGSLAAPGFPRPEGVVVRHDVSGHVYKALLENDQAAKSDLPSI